MTEFRIKSHPILKIDTHENLSFFWQDQIINSHLGETIASALIANGINIFGHHPKDHAPLGIFCANGQCSQCMVLLDGIPVKACMTFVKSGSFVLPAEGLPVLPEVKQKMEIGNTPATEIHVPVLIIGGGPAGLSAGIELGKNGIQTLLIDDKNKLGGKLVLQTHRFFGSTEAVYAGTRGIDIASKLEQNLAEYPSIETMLNTTAVAVYEDKSVGIWKENREYLLVKPEVLLVASGARERSLAFSGNTLPGVYGAGAFQTLVNRDKVLPSKNLFIVGGGNVGLIAGYHAMQAGINVVGLVEVLPECGGYKVHKDKLVRLGVPIFTSHTILSANGENVVESVSIAAINEHFMPIQSTEKTFCCDSILVAVGLDPVDEFISKAKEVGLKVFSAGDAQEIAEASAAMFSGKIRGNDIARSLGYEIPEVPVEWLKTEEILKSKPGDILENPSAEEGLVFPVMHCTQQIPCDPCSKVCPNNLIHIDNTDIRNLPEFCPTDEKNCIACERCVAICPGLAITLVDFRKNEKFPTVSIPLEFSNVLIEEGEDVIVTDVGGKNLLTLTVKKVRQLPAYLGTLIVRVQAPAEIATKISGIKLIAGELSDEDLLFVKHVSDDTYICRCERVTAGEIRQLILEGVRDINQIKAVTKASMGACGGKTCLRLILNLFREESVPLDEVYPTTVRPLFVEIPVSTIADLKKKES